MSDIKISMIKMFWGDSEYNLIRNAGRGEYTVVGKAKEDISSLITTIESQKELTGKDTRQIAQLLKELEGQRAITELAVNGLEEISDGGSTGEDARDMRTTADFTLAKIKEIQNGTT